MIFVTGQKGLKKNFKNNYPYSQSYNHSYMDLSIFIIKFATNKKMKYLACFICNDSSEATKKKTSRKVSL